MTDKAIREEAKRRANDSCSSSFTDELNYITGFEHGAEWVIEAERLRSLKLLEVMKRLRAMGESCLPLDKMEVGQWAHNAIAEYEASK